MSSELVNRVSIKKDGVYISTHSSNDTAPFTSHKNNTLTEVFKNEGQKGLDKYLLSLAFNNVEFVGRHKSVIPYRIAIHKFFNDKNNDPLLVEINTKTNTINDMFYKRQTLDDKGNIKLNDLILERNDLENKKVDIVLDIVQSERDKIISQEMEVD